MQTLQCFARMETNFIKKKENQKSVRIRNLQQLQANFDVVIKLRKSCSCSRNCKRMSDIPVLTVVSSTRTGLFFFDFILCVVDVLLSTDVRKHSI